MSENPFAGQGAVLLDIGDDIGALVVEMPSEMVGVEIEIRPAGDRAAPHSHYPHVAVVERPSPQGPVASLVFGGLREGTYSLHDKGADEVLATTTVRGNAVTEMSWAQPENADKSSAVRHTP